MRRLLLPALFCLLLLPLQTLAATRICVSMAAFDDNFLTLLRTAIADSAQSAGNIQLQFADAREDKTTQQNHIRLFIEKKCQAIIVVSVDASVTYVQQLSQQARAARIPLVFVNRKPDLPLGNGIYYVGSDDYLAGQLQMEYLASISSGKGNVAIMIGQQASTPAIERTHAVKDVIAKYPDLHLVAEQVANFSRVEGENLMKQWLQEGKKIDMVAANNDEMALGALNAMKKVGIPARQILITGIDATSDALDSMYNNELAATVFQNARAQGETSLATAVALANQATKVPAENLIPFELVTPENYKMYLRQ